MKARVTTRDMQLILSRHFRYLYVSHRGLRNLGLRGILLVATISLLSQESLAAKYNGQFRMGGLNSKVQYLEPIQGEESNDASLLSTRLFMQGKKIYSRRDFMVLDLRDRYDFFGRTNSELLGLEPENTIQLRQVAYGVPWQESRHFYSLGRFALPEAGVISNDGFEYGYRISSRLRMGVFAGIAPEDVVTPISYTQDFRGYDGNQGGIYAIYKNEDVLTMRTTYFSNTIAQVPSFELNSFVNKVYLHHQGQFNFGYKWRLSSFLNFDIMPENKIRRLHLNLGYYQSRFRVQSGIHTITPDDYRIKKDIDDDLPPSAFSSLDLSLKYLFSGTLSLSLKGDYGRRSLDGLSRSEVMAGPTMLLFGRRVSMAAYAGVRENFLSSEVFAKMSSVLYFRSFSLSASYTNESETFDDGSTFEPSIIQVELGIYPSKRFRGSVSYFSATTKERVISTSLMSLAYNFGARNTPPNRKRASAFEEL